MVGPNRTGDQASPQRELSARLTTLTSENDDLRAENARLRGEVPEMS